MTLAPLLGPRSLRMMRRGRLGPARATRRPVSSRQQPKALPASPPVRRPLHSTGLASSPPQTREDGRHSPRLVADPNHRRHPLMPTQPPRQRLLKLRWGPQRVFSVLPTLDLLTLVAILTRGPQSPLPRTPQQPESRPTYSRRGAGASRPWPGALLRNLRGAPAVLPSWLVGHHCRRTTGLRLACRLARTLPRPAPPQAKPLQV